MAQNSSNYYLESIKKKIKTLDLKKGEYEAQVVEKNNRLDQNTAIEQRLKFTYGLLKEQYDSLLRLVEKQGIVFEINLSEYKVMQWENLFIMKTSKGYEIRTKTGSVLMMLDKSLSKIIEDIDKKNSYSLIVIRASHKAALALLRFI